MYFFLTRHVSCRKHVRKKMVTFYVWAEQGQQKDQTEGLCENKIQSLYCQFKRICYSLSLSPISLPRFLILKSCYASRMLFCSSSKINPKFKFVVFNTSKENDFEKKTYWRSNSLVQVENDGRDREKRGMLYQKLLVLYYIV